MQLALLVTTIWGPVEAAQGGGGHQSVCVWRSELVQRPAGERCGRSGGNLHQRWFRVLSLWRIVQRVAAVQRCSAAQAAADLDAFRTLCRRRPLTLTQFFEALYVGSASATQSAGGVGCR